MTHVSVLLPWETIKIPVSREGCSTAIDGYVRYDPKTHFFIATVYPVPDGFAVRLHIDLEHGGHQHLTKTLEEARALADLKLKEAGYKLLADKHMSLF